MEFKTWQELFDFCVKNAECIYVRYHMSNGKIGNVPLSEVKFTDGVGFISIWFTDRLIPQVIVRDADEDD